MDIAAISSALGALKAATDLVKVIRESDLSLEKAETKLKLAELISALADAKIAVAEMQEEMLAKDKRIRELEDQREKVEKLIYVAPFYWRISGTERDGPFCQKCHDTQEKIVYLQQNPRDKGLWSCRGCGSGYRDVP